MPQPAESDPERSGDRADGTTGRRSGGESRAESPAGAGRSTPRRKLQADHRRYRKAVNGATRSTDCRHRRKDAGQGNRPTASPAKPDRYGHAGQPARAVRAARRQQAGSGETRSRQAAGDAGDTSFGATRRPVPPAQLMDWRGRGNP